jgi:regulator of sirC expression with transglutaminase-like and TPR domain
VDSLQVFADLVNRPDAEIDLGRAAAMIALHDYPRLDLDRVGLALDACAEGVSSLNGLRERLFDDLGFTGDEQEYYQPDNSYLHRVLERRRGIPITLGVLVVEVGRRAGVPVEPVAMPGHFLVREPESGAYLDPFHGGVVLDEAGCEELFRSTTGAGPEVHFGDFMLPVVGPLAVLERMLANLAYACRCNADAAGLEWALRLRLALPEVTGQDVVALGEALADQGRATEAVAELENWADLSPELGGALRKAARGLIARLN